MVQIINIKLDKNVILLKVVKMSYYVEINSDFIAISLNFKNKLSLNEKIDCNDLIYFFTVF